MNQKLMVGIQYEKRGIIKYNSDIQEYLFFITIITPIIISLSLTSLASFPFIRNKKNKKKESC